MANLCPPLSAGEDTLEAVEKQIQELLERQTELRERRAALESSRVSPVHPGRDLPRCPSLRRRDTTDPGCSSSGRREPGPFRGPRPSRCLRSSRSPPGTAFPLRKTERDAVIVGDSIVRYVRATLAKGKVHTHCFPGARVLDVSAQIPAILKDGESVGAIVLHAGVNDIKLRQTEVLKRDFSSLIETVRSTSPAMRIIVSGPLPTYRRGHERLFRADGLHPSRVGAELLSDNISRTLCSI
ncbi:uncharacterized protein LOC127159114 [Labeo rohita]|uniref:uncharacterized protein LOC127159114 n=1 Tax=Labeo rohita TaxID=84645 RepID=UPI0021E1D26D|nr:uncharacterized protein LOC127159114 [Labeo rohita]